MAKKELNNKNKNTNNAETAFITLQSKGLGKDDLMFSVFDRMNSF